MKLGSVLHLAEVRICLLFGPVWPGVATAWGAMLGWSQGLELEWHYIDPGKPQQN